MLQLGRYGAADQTGGMLHTVQHTVYPLEHWSSICETTPAPSIGQPLPCQFSKRFYTEMTLLIQLMTILCTDSLCWNISRNFFSFLYYDISSLSDPQALQIAFYVLYAYCWGKKKLLEKKKVWNMFSTTLVVQCTSRVQRR